MFRSNKDSSPASSSFAHRMQLRGNAEYERLNRSTAAAMERAFSSFSVEQEEDRLARAVGLVTDEYIRQSTLLDQLYRTEGCLLGMGQDENYQLGFYSVSEEEVSDKSKLPPTFIALGLSVRQVSAGGVHSLALSCQGVPYSWGTNDNGALGRRIANEMEQTCPMAVTGFRRRDTGAVEDGQILQIATGDMHSLFLSASGAVYQCGAYQDSSYVMFSDAGEDGKVDRMNELPVHVHQIPGTAIAIFAGISINAALLSDHSLVTWGCGNRGELARSSGMTSPSADGKYDLDKDFYYKKERNEQGELELTNIPDLDIVKEHFLKPKPVLWHSNPSLKRTVISVGIGTAHLVVAARDPGQLFGKVYTSGLNAYGQLGLGDEGRGTERHALTWVEALKNDNIGQVAAGDEFSLALSLDRNYLFSFGMASKGQLGIGVVTNELECRNTPQIVQFPQPVKILEIAAGSNFAMARTEEHELYTWGFDEEGATGHLNVGTDIFRPRKINLMDHVPGDGISHCHVVGMSAGTFHSLVLAQFFRPAAGTQK